MKKKMINKIIIVESHKMKNEVRKKNDPQNLVPASRMTDRQYRMIQLGIAPKIWATDCIE